MAWCRWGQMVWCRWGHMLRCGWGHMVQCRWGHRALLRLYICLYRLLAAWCENIMFALFVFLIVLVGTGCCCRCPMQSKEELYCKAEFVILARVISDLIDPNRQQDFDNYYVINIITKYKLISLPNVVDLTRVYTGSNSAMCGAYLEHGTDYILSGTINHELGRMEINTCQSWIEQDPLSLLATQILSQPPDCTSLQTKPSLSSVG